MHVKVVCKARERMFWAQRQQVIIQQKSKGQPKQGRQAAPLPDACCQINLGGQTMTFQYDGRIIMYIHDGRNEICGGADPD